MASTLRGGERLSEVVMIKRLATALAALCLLLSSASTAQTLRPYFPIFGGGSFTNLQDGNDAAWTNASAHVAWALAIPAVGRVVAGRKGMWIAGLSWVGLSVLQEAFFHAPPNASHVRSYPSEVRTDMLTRVTPTLTFCVLSQSLRW